ncbi:MAG TPA: ABC transporter ATP-binding protein [Acidimicrobiales bacterium]
MGAGDAQSAGRPGGTLRRALRSQRKLVLLGGALVTVHQLAEVLVPVTVGVVIDRAIAPGDAAAAVRWLAVLAGQFVLLSAAGCTAVWIDEKARQGAAHTVRTAVAARVLDERGGVERALPGEIVSLSTVETTRIGDGVGAVIVATGAVAGTLGGAVILFAYSVWLGAVVVVGLPVVLLVVQALAEPLVSRADEHQRAVGRASGVAADLFHGLRVLKGLGADRAAATRYRSVSREALTAGLAANRARSTYAGLTYTIAGVFVALVAWLAARLALDGTIGLGSLVATLGVTQFLVGPLGRLAYAGEQLAQARASSEHLDAALDAEPAVVGGSATLSGDGGGADDDVRRGTLDLVLDGVTHGTLRGVSLRVPAGGTVGIVAAPADAAALADLLDRSVDPVRGRVLVGGADHTELPLDTARAAVVVAHHDAPLFGPTIAADLRSVRRAASDDDGHDGADEGADDGPGDAAGIDDVVAAACLDDVADVVPGGLDGPITEAGRSLSGGQRQRVALARALATDAPVLVLHEPTTAVDTATEQRIAAGLRRLRAGRTTVLITASPTLLAAADRVVLLDDGRVVAEGDHATLAADPRYRRAVLG